MLWMGGVLYNCIAHSSTVGSRASAFLETTRQGTTIDRNIDVKFTNLRTSNAGSSALNVFGAGVHVHSNNYSYQLVSNTAFNVYLAPLD